jgi:hypothetical protein
MSGLGIRIGRLRAFMWPEQMAKALFRTCWLLYLQSAGYKTGLYTSPHLVDFRERIRINGEMIPQGKVVDFVMKNQQVITEIAPSFFEMTVAMAFDYFARENVEVAVIETGLGRPTGFYQYCGPCFKYYHQYRYGSYGLVGTHFAIDCS